MRLSKTMTKACAYICSATLVVTGITFYPSQQSNAAETMTLDGYTFDVSIDTETTTVTGLTADFVEETGLVISWTEALDTATMKGIIVDETVYEDDEEDEATEGGEAVANGEEVADDAVDELVVEDGDVTYTTTSATIPVSYFSDFIADGDYTITISGKEVLPEDAEEDTEARELKAVVKLNVVDEDAEDETVTTTVAAETEGEETAEPTSNEETDAVEPTSAEETDAAEPTSNEETDAVEPTSAEETDAAEPTSNEETDAVEPTSAEETDAVEPTSNEETDAVEPTSDEETDAVEPTSAEETETAEPATDEETGSDETTTAEVTETETESETVKEVEIPEGYTVLEAGWNVFGDILAQADDGSGISKWAVYVAEGAVVAAKDGADSQDTISLFVASDVAEDADIQIARVFNNLTVEAPYQYALDYTIGEEAAKLTGSAVAAADGKIVAIEGVGTKVKAEETFTITGTDISQIDTTTQEEYESWLTTDRNLAYQKEVSLSGALREGTLADLTDGVANEWNNRTGLTVEGTDTGYFEIDLGATYDAKSIDSVVVWWRTGDNNFYPTKGYKVQFGTEKAFMTVADVTADKYPTPASTGWADGDQYMVSALVDKNSVKGNVSKVRIFIDNPVAYGAQIAEVGVFAENPEDGKELEASTPASGVTVTSDAYNAITYTIEAAEGQVEDGYTYYVYLDGDTSIGEGVAAGTPITVTGIAAGTHTVTVVAVGPGMGESEGIVSDEVEVIDLNEAVSAILEGKTNIASTLNNAKSQIISVSSFSTEEGEHDIDTAQAAIDGDTAVGQGPDVAVRTGYNNSPQTIIIDLGDAYKKDQFIQVAIEHSNPRTYASDVTVSFAEEDGAYTEVASKTGYQATLDNGVNINLIPVDVTEYPNEGVRYVKVVLSGGVYTWGYVVNEIGVIVNTDASKAKKVGEADDPEEPTTEPTTSETPGETTTTDNGETTTGAAGEQTTAAPGTETTGVAGEQTTAAPGTETTKAAGEQTTAAPGTETTGAAGEQTTAAPGTETTGAGEQTTAVPASDITLDQTFDTEDTFKLGGYDLYVGANWNNSKVIAGVDANDADHVKVQNTSSNWDFWGAQVQKVLSNLIPGAEYTVEWPIKADNNDGTLKVTGDAQVALTGGEQLITGKFVADDNGNGKFVIGMGCVGVANPIEYFAPTIKDADGNVVYPSSGEITTAEPTTAGGTETTELLATTSVAETTVAPTTATPATTVAPTTTKTTTVKLAKAKVTKATKKKAAKKVKVTLKKIKNAKTYQVAIYKTKKNAKKNKKALVKKTVKKVKATIKSKKLKNKKKLFVRARAVSGKTTGAWSKPKKVKVK